MSKKAQKSSLLKLHPHKHTGKLLHHRHTSYRALFLLLVMTGVVLLVPFKMARADSYNVNAIVPAPLSTEPAVITNPSDSTVVRQPNVRFSGSCPVINPPLIVVLYDGSSIVGSQYCATDGTFSILVGLTPGHHSIVPQIMNFTGQMGTAGKAVLITYIAPIASDASPAVPASQAVTPKPAGDNSLKIITGAPFIIYGPAKDAIWKGRIGGGAPPYGLTISWGDGTINKRTALSTGGLELRHHYNHSLIYQVRIDVYDAAGNVQGISLIALTPAAYASYTATPTWIDSTNLSRAWLLYVLYLVTIAVLVLFWQRERVYYAKQVVPFPYIQHQRPAPRKRRK